MNLQVLAYNMKRVVRILGIEPRLRALQTGAARLVLRSTNERRDPAATPTPPNGVTNISRRMRIALDLNDADIVDPGKAGFSPGA